MTRMTALSIIIPVLDESENIAACLESLVPLRARGAQIVVVDGGSRDDTVQRALPLADIVISAPRGRAGQLNAGARQASAATLLFLHADTRLPDHADTLIESGIRDSQRVWGRFDVRIAGSHRLLPVIAWFMNQRSRLTGIATGDQGMFATRAAFDRAGGFPAIPLMEDIALCKALKKQGPPLCLRARITASGRRWEQRGAFTTMVLMWRLRLSYFFGADPDRLAQQYYGKKP
jgi:rSAM/selenodomain-associated transferase 2